MKYLILGILLISTAAYAADWRLVSESDAVTFGIDFQTVDIIDRDVIGIWLRTVNRIPRKTNIGCRFDDGTYSEFLCKREHYIIERVIVDCRLRALQTVRYVSYDTGGNVIHSDSDIEDKKMVIPGTTGETIAMKTCLWFRK